MSGTTAWREGGLDFRPHDAELPNSPGPWRVAWSVSADASRGRSGLLKTEDGLALVNTPSGIIELGDEPPGDERELADARLITGPALEGGAVLIDEDANIYRWTPGTPARKVWEVAAPWPQLQAIGLRGEALLVEYQQDGERWVTELVDPGAGVRWTRKEEFSRILPWEEALFVVHGDRQTVERMNAIDGERVWRQPVGGHIGNLIAVVAGTLWLRTYEGELLALAAETGVTEKRIRVPLVAVLEGVVDERNLFHLCTGSSYSLLDLAGGGARLAGGELPVAEDSPSVVFGGAAIPTRDGRLVFFDRNGAVFTARAGQTAAPTLLWRSRVPLLDCRAGKGMLFVLDREGMLAALSP